MAIPNAQTVHFRRFARIDRGALLLCLAYVLAFPLLFRPLIHGVDPVGYYAWLRSIVIDGDLNVANEFAHFANDEPRTIEFGRRVDRSIITPAGYQHNQWAPGSALLWLPFFLIAHSAVLLARLFGAAIAADGYSWPYQAGTAFGSTLYALAAVLLTYRVARGYFAPFAATLAVFVAWFASSLVFYGFSHPLMSHANDTFGVALVVFAWWWGRTQPALKAGVAVGAAIGLSTWIRSQNALSLCAPLLVLGVEAAFNARARAFAQIRQNLQQGAATLLGFALLFIPLMLFWRVVYGAWLVNSYAASQGPRSLDWRAPHLLEALFSSNRGLFIWTPVTLPALLGLWWLRRHDWRLALLLGLIFAAQLYVVGSWFQWHGATSFGLRLLTHMMPVFALGLGALLTRLERVPRRVLLAVGCAFVIWNLLLIVQYSLQTVPRGGPVDLAEMVKNQFLVIPNNVERLIGVLLKRN